MSEIVVKVPPGIDAEKLRKRIEALLPVAASDEFEKIMELIEEHGFLKLQEDSLREFLEEEPDVYTKKDVKR